LEEKSPSYTAEFSWAHLLTGSLNLNWRHITTGINPAAEMFTTGVCSVEMQQNSCLGFPKCVNAQD